MSTNRPWSNGWRQEPSRPASSHQEDDIPSNAGRSRPRNRRLLAEPPGGLATCQFPFHAKDDAFKKNKQAQIGGLTPALQERIRSMQVFYQPESELARPLRLLHDLARVDRHRLLHVMAAQPTQLQLNPPIVAAPYIEATVTVHVFFVDRDFMQVDTQQTLLNSINAVGWALVRMREPAGQ